MTYDTSTSEGREKRLDEVIAHYRETRNVRALVRLIGGSIADFTDHNPGYDDGEPPKGAEQE